MSTTVHQNNCTDSTIAVDLETLEAGTNSVPVPDSSVNHGLKRRRSIIPRWRISRTQSIQHKSEGLYPALFDMFTITHILICQTWKAGENLYSSSQKPC
jgi:hypothetical protein